MRDSNWAMVTWSRAIATSKTVSFAASTSVADTIVAMIAITAARISIVILGPIANPVHVASQSWSGGSNPNSRRINLTYIKPLANSRNSS